MRGALPERRRHRPKETNEPPVFTINGDNPATISTGATCSDLGATITGPQADLNIGIHLLVDAVPVDAVQLDATVPSEHRIDYVATGHSGLTSATTRTVIRAALAVPAAA